MSTRICLLNLPYAPRFGRSARWQETGRGGSLYYPLWLAYAAAVLEQNFEIKLVDTPALGWGAETTLKYFEKEYFDLTVIETSYPSLKSDLLLADKIKSVTGSKILVSGPPASVMDEWILNNSQADFVARYEYDYTVKELVEVLQKNKPITSVKGIAFKKDGRIIRTPNRPFTTSKDLDRIPFVSSVYKQHLNIRSYFLSSSLHPEVQIFTGRGCPFQCTFCLWPQTFTGRTVRYRSVKNVVDELEYIRSELPFVREVVFEDDTFSIDKKRVQAICNEIIRRKIDVTWNCQVRASLDYETMKLMKKAGCRLVIVGFESGDECILKNIKKGITLHEIKKFSQSAKKAGLLVHADFIFGLPGETRKSIEKTRKLIKEIKPDILQISVATPYPGTEFYEWAKSYGYLAIQEDSFNSYLDEKGHQRCIVSYPGLSSEEIVQAVDETLKSYYMSLNYIPVIFRQIFRRNWLDESKRLLKAGLSFTSRYLSP